MKAIALSRGLVVAAIIFVSQLVTHPSAFADGPKYDLYSWQKEDATYWCFALLPSSKEVADVIDVKAVKDQVCGRHDAKRLMGSLMTEGSKIYWKTNEAQGLVLPPAEIVNDMKRFATSMDYKMIMPKGKDVKGDGFK